MATDDLRGEPLRRFDGGDERAVARVDRPMPRVRSRCSPTRRPDTPPGASAALDLQLFSLGLAMQPLQWITVVGPIGVSDVGLVLVALALLPRVWRSVWRVTLAEDFAAVVTVGSLMLCTGAIGLSVCWSPAPVEGLLLMARDLAVAGLCGYVYTAFRDLDYREVCQVFGRALRFAAVLLTIAVTVTLAARGVNILDTYRRAVLTAEPNLVQYEVFHRLFGVDDEREGAFGRHTMFLLVAIGAALTWLSTQQAARRRANALPWVQFAAMIALVVSSLSRQACLVAAITVAVAVLQTKSQAVRVAIGLSVLILGTLLATGPARELIQAKFVDDVVDNPRVNQFHEVSAAIARYPASGRGAGVQIKGAMNARYYAHNLVLHGWHQAGLLGLIASLSAVIALTSVTAYAAWLSMVTEGFSRAASAASFVLFMVPMIRCMLGVRGSFEVSALFGLAAALLILRGVTMQRRPGQLAGHAAA